MNIRAKVFVAILTSATLSGVAIAADTPSRPAEKGCTWEKFSDENLGLAGWFQKCDFGFRKIDFLIKGHSLLMRYSDGGEPEPLVDVLDLRPGESDEAGLKRLFAERTDKKLVARCVLAPYTGTDPVPGAKLYTFAPDAAFAREIEKAATNDEVGDPPCGDWGDAPDGIQYFETQPSSGSRHVLFVRVGQDVPLFDEQTLRLLPAAGPAPATRK